MIRINKGGRLFSDVLCCTGCALLFFCAVMHSRQLENGALKGIEYCIKILVPSLFPFMVFSSFLINSGASDIIKSKTRLVTKKFGGVSADIFSVVLLALTGGYPVGAKCVALLYQNGAVSEKQAEKMSFYAVGAGPGFLITYVGTELLNCKKAGFVLLISQAASVLVLAVLCEMIFKNTESSDKEFKEKLSPEKRTPSYALVMSTSQAVMSIVNMCAMVVLFSAVLEISDYLLYDYKAVSEFLNIFAEVTAACQHLSEKGSLIMLAFAVGFGGICVHFQIFSILKDIKINKIIFFSMRLVQGLITAAVAGLIFHFFPISVEVFRSADSFSVTSYGTVWGGIAFMLCSVCFLFSIKASGYSKH